MKTWAEMTERERDVLVAETTGAQIYEVVEGRNFESAKGRKIVLKNKLPFSKPYAPYETKVFDAETGELTDVTSRYLIPHFSTDRAAAMSLLDEFDAFQLWKELSGVHGCELTNAGTKVFIAEGDTMPEAICKAFLRSKDVKFG